MALEYWFPTPIYYFDHPQPERINARVAEMVLAKRAADPQGLTRSNDLGWHSAVDLQRDAAFAELSDWLAARMGEVFSDQAYDPACPPEWAEMWANVSPPGAHNRWHTHPGALWSGCYYVRTPPDCGRIFFTDPRPQAQVLLPRQGTLQPAQWREVHYAPQAGRVLFFPAWLGHEVEASRATLPGEAGLRISIAFNFRQGAPVQGEPALQP